MALRGPHPKTGKMEPPAYALCSRVPGPPESLCKIGGILWKVVAEGRFDRGVLTVFGLASLQVYCGSFALWRDLTEAAQKNGYVMTTHRGTPFPNPEVVMAAQQAKLMMSLAKEFGFTPGSQSRIAIVPEKTADVNPLAAARKKLAEMGTARPS